MALEELEEEEDLFGDEDNDDPPPLPPPLLATDGRPDSSSSNRRSNNNNDNNTHTGATSSATGQGDEEEEENREEEEEKVKKVRKPLLTLKVERLFSENGIPYLTREFPKLKFKGKGHEASDLKYLLKQYEHWANRVYPKYTFNDFIKRVETMGSKSSHFKMEFRNMRYRSAGITVPGEGGGEEEDEGEGGIEQEIEREEEEEEETQRQSIMDTSTLSTQPINDNTLSQPNDNTTLSNIDYTIHNTSSQNILPLNDDNNSSSSSSNSHPLRPSTNNTTATTTTTAITANNTTTTDDVLTPDLWDIQLEDSAAAVIEEDDPYNDIGDLLDNDDI